MLQLDKGGSGKNPADFSECWNKQLLNYLNTSKISLSLPFFCLLLILRIALFSQKANNYFFFIFLFFKLKGG